jgi:hypothetical protein
MGRAKAGDDRLQQDCLMEFNPMYLSSARDTEAEEGCD